MPDISAGKKPKVVLDTSVIIAGLLSPYGGSGKILEACRQNKIACAISSLTGGEIERNLAKFPSWMMRTFRQFAADFFNEIKPSAADIVSLAAFVDPDDAHILSACKIFSADYLVSLNRKHLLNNHRAQSAVAARIVSPKDLITELKL